MTQVSYNRKRLSGPPLSVTGLSRPLSYDVDTDTVYWRRRKQEVVPSKRGTVRIRGHNLPLDYIKTALTAKEFPAPINGMLPWQDHFITTLKVRGNNVLVGVYPNTLLAILARNEVFNYLLNQTYGPTAVLTGARKGNSTGFRGVSYLAARKKYIGRVTHDRKTRSVGSFDTPEEAYDAVLAEEARAKCS